MHKLENSSNEISFDYYWSILYSYEYEFKLYEPIGYNLYWLDSSDSIWEALGSVSDISFSLLLV